MGREGLHEMGLFMKTNGKRSVTCGRLQGSLHYSSNIESIKEKYGGRDLVKVRVRQF